MSAFKGNSRPQTPTVRDGDQYAKVINGLKHIYNSKIKPLETTYNFEGNPLLSCLCFFTRVLYFLLTMQQPYRLPFVAFD
jgi:N-terminal EH-domain containing protein